MNIGFLLPAKAVTKVVIASKAKPSRFSDSGNGLPRHACNYENRTDNRRAGLWFLAFAFLSLPCFAMERSYSAPESDFNIRFARVVLPVAATLVRTFTQWNQEPEATLTTRAPANRGVFLVTNEHDNQVTLREARALQRRGYVGIGVSALFNLELFLARAEAGVTHWVMIDPAPEVQAFWQTFLMALRESEDLNFLFDRLHRMLSENSNRFFTPGFLELNGMLQTEHFTRWLTTNLNEAKARLLAAMGSMSFAQFKRLMLEGLLLFPTDLADASAVQHLVTYLQIHGFEIDTLYASNVFMQLPQHATDAFRQHIATLRLVTSGEALAYLIEALPTREGELARITGTPFQKIYHE